jgi:hypothetical protein
MESTKWGRAAPDCNVLMLDGVESFPLDDIALATSLISWNKNAKVLQREVKKRT